MKEVCSILENTDQIVTKLASVLPHELNTANKIGLYGIKTSLNYSYSRGEYRVAFCPNSTLDLNKGTINVQMHAKCDESKALPFEVSGNNIFVPLNHLKKGDIAFEEAKQCISDNIAINTEEISQRVIPKEDRAKHVEKCEQLTLNQKCSDLNKI